MRGSGRDIRIIRIGFFFFWDGRPRSLTVLLRILFCQVRGHVGLVTSYISVRRALLKGWIERYLDRKADPLIVQRSYAMNPGYQS
jgi:hypothetical protein